MALSPPQPCLHCLWRQYNTKQNHAILYNYGRSYIMRHYTNYDTLTKSLKNTLLTLELAHNGYFNHKRMQDDTVVFNWHQTKHLQIDVE